MSPRPWVSWLVVPTVTYMEPCLWCRLLQSPPTWVLSVSLAQYYLYLMSLLTSYSGFSFSPPLFFNILPPLYFERSSSVLQIQSGSSAGPARTMSLSFTFSPGIQHRLALNSRSSFIIIIMLLEACSPPGRVHERMWMTLGFDVANLELWLCASFAQESLQLSAFDIPSCLRFSVAVMKHCGGQALLP